MLPQQYLRPGAKKQSWAFAFGSSGQILSLLRFAFLLSPLRAAAHAAHLHDRYACTFFLKEGRFPRPLSLTNLICYSTLWKLRLYRAPEAPPLLSGNARSNGRRRIVRSHGHWLMHEQLGTRGAFEDKEEKEKVSKRG